MMRLSPPVLVKIGNTLKANVANQLFLQKSPYDIYVVISSG